MREVLNRVDTITDHIVEIRSDQRKLVQMCATQEQGKKHYNYPTAPKESN